MLLSVILASCGTTDTTSINNGTPWISKSPKVGSTFSYRYRYVDSSGVALSDALYSRDTVLAVGLRVLGKPNVTYLSGYFRTTM